MRGRVEATQVAKSTPFDNSTNGFLATETQSAIEEVNSKVTGKPRAVISFNYGGTANSGRWLERITNTGSDVVPFYCSEPMHIKALSLITSDAANTGTVTLYKNGVSLTTISLTAEKYYTISGLSYAFAVGNYLSAQVTSGSISRPQLDISVEIDL